MARLIVEARTAEWTSGDVVFRLLLAASVSRESDGKPVTGLKTENFRVAASIGTIRDFNVVSAHEWMWEPADNEPSGCYALDLMLSPTEKFGKGTRYVFGVQARTFTGTPPRVVDRGQTIVELISTGE